MKDIVNSCRKYWFLFLVSLLLAIRGANVAMYLIWVMTSYIDDMILAMLSASLFMTFIVTLPIDYVCYKISKEFSLKVAFKLWAVLFMISYGIMSGIYLLIAFVKLN